MAQSLILKTKDDPSWFNKDTAIGLLLAGPVGAVIGGFIGKRRMESDKEHGKTVTSEPSFWNKDTLFGGLAGNLLGGIAGRIMMFIAASGPEVSLAGVALGAMTWVGSIAIGTYLGGKTGEARLQHEYNEARQQKIVNNLGQSMSPEIAQAVEYRLTNDKEWGNKVLEEKLLAAGRENART